ncbi:phosphatidylglycerophosphatase A [Comamonas serinivorans]|uniref:Phosphatidylglycerophosphatase A n=2 Tax=Comamonas serinivorans TaxID=1082851 RepID=A0A1Y0ETG8_9BURK|nr:phosphatidylglycerophosphatase A [Comamonas serinivorans]
MNLPALPPDRIEADILDAVPRPASADSRSGRPTAQFMRQHAAHWIALGFGSGLSPVAPGTVGTLWAWLAWALLAQWLSPVAQGVLIAGTVLVGWWASFVTARHLRQADPSNVVIDEIAAFWLVLWLIAPSGFWGQLVAFGLFRYFDAAKPGPVGWADRLLHGARGWRGAWGILWDDLVAAFCTLLVIALWRWFAG